MISGHKPHRGSVVHQSLSIKHRKLWDILPNASEIDVVGFAIQLSYALGQAIVPINYLQRSSAEYVVDNRRNPPGYQ